MATHEGLLLESHKHSRRTQLEAVRCHMNQLYCCHGYMSLTFYLRNSQLKVLTSQGWLLISMEMEIVLTTALH